MSTIHDSHSQFQRKMYKRLLVQYHPCPIGSVLPLNLTYKCNNWGHAVAKLVEALSYKAEGSGFESR
jgi:hypothetical protein